eukprot:snap_masked-scaffold_1-processed-gene-18.11-mRNA-1 protein AED:1.00 eAED:1.00 QI:0/-1/0/0/-1/1/1/0/69
MEVLIPHFGDKKDVEVSTSCSHRLVVVLVADQGKIGFIVLHIIFEVPWWWGLAENGVVPDFVKLLWGVS